MKCFVCLGVMAYLDPGTMSYFLQIVVGILVGSVVAVKLSWARITNFIKGLFSKRKKK